MIRDIDGMSYFNTGDWVESSSALLENLRGEIELITHFETQKGAAPDDLIEISLDVLLNIRERRPEGDTHNAGRKKPAPLPVALSEIPDSPGPVAPLKAQGE